MFWYSTLSSTPNRRCPAELQRARSATNSVIPLLFLYANCLKFRITTRAPLLFACSYALSSAGSTDDVSSPARSMMYACANASRARMVIACFAMRSGLVLFVDSQSRASVPRDVRVIRSRRGERRLFKAAPCRGRRKQFLRLVRKSHKPKDLCVFSETYKSGRFLVGADLRAARGEWGASGKPAGSEIRPYQNRTSSGTMSNPALRQSVISATTPIQAKQI